MTGLEAHQIVELCLDQATTADAVVLVSTTSVANLRWARNTLTTNGETTQTSVTVIAIDGAEDARRVGSATRGTSDPAELRDLVGSACDAARSAQVAPDAAPLVRGDADIEFTYAPVETSGEVFAGIAPSLGEVFRQAVAEGREHFGYAEHHVTTTHLGTSGGVRRRHVQPVGRLELTAKAEGRRTSAWRGLTSDTFTDVDVHGCDAELVRALEWQGRSVQVDAGRHTAILAPSAVSDLAIDLYWSLVGRDAAEGHSVFSAPGGAVGRTRIGTPIVDTRVTLSSDPGQSGSACADFMMATASSSVTSVFDNGLPLAATKWIDAGVLTGLVTTRAGAAEFDLPVRPPIDNLTLDVESGHGTLDDLIARTDRALLVTCLWYQRLVDPQTLLFTGLTRDGVYLVEGGEVVGSVTNFRYNESPLGVLGRITDSSARTRTLAREMGDYFNRATAPALRVEDFNFSTVSQAS